MTVENIMLYKELIELVCTLILLIITGASALIALSAYKAQIKSIQITQWTTLKLLREDIEQTYSLLVLRNMPENDLTAKNALNETIQRMQDRKTEIQGEIRSLEKQLGLKTDKNLPNNTSNERNLHRWWDSVLYQKWRDKKGK
jgi:hypothetical protein